MTYLGDSLQAGLSRRHTNRDRLRPYAGRLIANQCRMPQSIPGDSGGPVWQPSRDGGATTVGIWLGQHVDQDGAFGRFASLTDVLPTISAQAKTRIL